MTKTQFLFLLLILVILSACKITQQERIPFYQVTQVVTNDDKEPILKGTITELSSGEPIIFGTIALFQEDKLLTGIEADFEGNYNFSLPEITDSVIVVLESSYLGMHTVRIENLVLYPGMVTKLDIQMEQEQELMDGLYCPIDWGVPLIEQDNTTSGQIFTSEQIRRSGVRSN